MAASNVKSSAVTALTDIASCYEMTILEGDNAAKLSLMIDHDTFSQLRLSRVFQDTDLLSYPSYVAVEPRGSFDTEYLGGQWHEERIDGVQFFYPAEDGDKLGVLQLWGDGYLSGTLARDQPDPSHSLLVPTWAANANRALDALELPIQLGSNESAVRSLATGRVTARPFPDAWYDQVKNVPRGSLSSLAFVLRAPDIYHMSAVLDVTEGLIRLEIRRPDLIRVNESEKGTYNLCCGWMFEDIRPEPQ